MFSSPARIILHAAALLLITMNCARAATLPSFKEAVKNYNEKKYAIALAQFNEIICKHPSDANSHYYSALCYQALGQVKTAEVEYTWVYSHAVDANLRYNSWQALNQIRNWSKHRAYSGNGGVRSIVIRRT